MNRFRFLSAILMCGVGLAALAHADTELGQPSTRIVPATGWESASPRDAGVGPLAHGLECYLPLDGHLAGVNAEGIEETADFIRDSAARFPDLRPAIVHQPRFVPGRFGQGVLVEYQSKNRFPSSIAEVGSIRDCFAAVGAAQLRRSEGPEAIATLEVAVGADGGGFRTRAVVVPRTHYQTFSLYLKGPARQKLTISARPEERDQPLGNCTVGLTGEWQRVSIDYIGTPERDPPYESQVPASEPIVFEVTLASSGAFSAQALMLETHIGYGHRQGLSSWIPGGLSRAGDILSLPPPRCAEQGSIAFWVNLQGNLGWRVLLCVGNGTGWQPDLRLDLADHRRLGITARNRIIAQVALPQPWTTGVWRHVVASYNDKLATVYLDGREILRTTDLPPRTALGQVTFGGVAIEGSPAFRADAIFDECACWSRSLKPEEVVCLAARKRPLGDGLNAAMTLADLEPVAVFARDQVTRGWPVRVTNRGGQPLAGLRIRHGIEGLKQETVPLPTVPSGASCELNLPWSPAHLNAGTYRFAVRLEGNGATRDWVRPIEIVPARRPLANVPVINWSGYDAEYASLGITSAGLDGSALGPRPSDVESAVRRGFYVQLRQFLTGAPSSQADFFADLAGKPAEVDQRAPQVAADVIRRAAVLSDRLARLPDVRQVILNSEHQWLSRHDARPETRAEVKRRYGLDLDRWVAAAAGEPLRAAHPLGRLSAKAAGYSLPAGGIVAADDPIYAYHRAWLGDAVGNEVSLNDTLARSIHGSAPWIACIAEPVLRRPAIRVFKEQDIIEEWFYYPDPATAVSIQESAAAAARGTRAKPAGMPQFLLKPGMAAPYGGFPTPHLYREAVWHCLARPLSALTYWNLGGAAGIRRSKEMLEQPQIDALLGKTPDWKGAEAKLQRKGEWTSVFLFIPELAAEVARIHRETVHPLGGLWGRWENRPRRLAVYRSFAGQLFNEVRWPGQDPLSRLVEHLGIPFDVLWDQDFEGNPGLLDGYQVVVLPECAAIAASAAEPLRRFLARGGRVIADDHFQVDLPGVAKFQWRGVADRSADDLAKTEQQLLREYGRTDHPLFLEGMEQAAAAARAAGGPTTAVEKAIRAGLKLETSSPTRHVFYNLLRLEGANYLVAVNDLRVPGRHYGHFGRCREDGVAQSAQFELDPGLGRYAYLLPEGKSLPLQSRDDRLRLQLALPPCGGAVVLLLNQPVGPLRLEAIQARAVKRGGNLCLAASLVGKDGQPLPGMIPAELTITEPGGARHDWSQAIAFVRGRWPMELPLAVNAPAGCWRVEIREHASGQRAAVQWELGE